MKVLLALGVLALAALLILLGMLFERRRRREEIRTASRLASLVRSVEIAVIGLGEDGRILTWNPGAERLLGAAARDMIGQPVEALHRIAPDIPAAVARARAERRTQEIEIDRPGPEGGHVRLLIGISPIRDAGRAIVGTSLLARDITRRAQMEEALRRSEATSRAFLEAASEAVVVVDTGGRIIQVNAKTEEMFGYLRDELLGQPVELLVPPRHREAHAAHRDAYMRAPRVRSMGRGLDLTGVKKDGVEFPVEVSLSYVTTDEGTRAIAFVTDISERLAYQRAVRQSDKLAALGTLSAGVAHEINNPIGIITSRVELMMLEAGDDALAPELRKDLEVILRHARRVATITQGLLSFARQSAGVQGPVQLNRVVEEIVQLAQKDMSRSRITVETRLAENLPLITADANAIGQVLLNLLTNARRAMPDGGSITIESALVDAGRWIRLSVEDTGSGIPPHVLPKIFDPFFTTASDGTGLGLSISHGIMEEHHGTIDVSSEVGKGTVFTLRFPAGAAVGR